MPCRAPHGWPCRSGFCRRISDGCCLWGLDLSVEETLPVAGSRILIPRTKWGEIQRISRESVTSLTSKLLEVLICYHGISEVLLCKVHITLSGLSIPEPYINAADILETYRDEQFDALR